MDGSEAAVVVVEVGIDDDADDDDGVADAVMRRRMPSARHDWCRSRCCCCCGDLCNSRSSAFHSWTWNRNDASSEALLLRTEPRKQKLRTVSGVV